MSKQGSGDKRQPLEGERKKAYRKLRWRLQGALGVLQGSDDSMGTASLALCHPFVPGRQHRVERLAQEQLLLMLTSLIKAVPRAVMDEIMADSEHVLCDTRFAVLPGQEEAAKQMRDRARANLTRLNGLR
ncbi:TPA: hypothetical protein ACSP3X_004321 [Aeromonas hydrophila]